MPHFPNGSGWGTLEDIVQLEWGNSWWSQTLWRHAEVHCLPRSGSRPARQTHYSHQHPDGQVVLKVEPSVLAAETIPPCIKSLRDLWHSEQACRLGIYIYTLGICNICIWIPNSLNVYCWFKVEATGEIPSLGLEVPSWSSSRLLRNGEQGLPVLRQRKNPNTDRPLLRGAL